MQTYTLPSSNAIKRFREEDFALDTKDKICIYHEECTLVLFYNESAESKKMLSIYKVAAETILNRRFAACNIELEPKVYEALVALYNMKDHPFSWCGSRGLPFILVYRRGYPVNFYEGPPDAAILTNFALNIACLPDFHSRNYLLNDKLNNEMWSVYKSKTAYNSYLPTPTKINDEAFLPAVPFKRFQK